MDVGEEVGFKEEKGPFAVLHADGLRPLRGTEFGVGGRGAHRVMTEDRDDPRGGGREFEIGESGLGSDPWGGRGGREGK